MQFMRTIFARRFSQWRCWSCRSGCNLFVFVNFLPFERTSIIKCLFSLLSAFFLCVAMKILDMLLLKHSSDLFYWEKSFLGSMKGLSVESFVNFFSQLVYKERGNGKYVQGSQSEERKAARSKSHMIWKMCARHNMRTKSNRGCLLFQNSHRSRCAVYMNSHLFNL